MKGTRKGALAALVVVNNGMSGARQAGSVDVVIVIQQVDAARTDITGFQDPTGSKFILKIQVVLANQRRMRHFIDEWDAQIRARQSSWVSPALYELSRRQIGERILNRKRSCCCAAIIERGRVRVSLLHGVHKTISSD